MPAKEICISISDDPEKEKKTTDGSFSLEVDASSQQPVVPPTPISTNRHFTFKLSEPAGNVSAVSSQQPVVSAPISPKTRSGSFSQSPQNLVTPSSAPGSSLTLEDAIAFQPMDFTRSFSR